MFKQAIVTFILVVSVFLAQAQERVPPYGGFMADSMKIGEPVPYALSYRYEASRDVIFPDSLSDFSPFELDHKVYFPTQTKDGISYDSAVYYLAYFELDTFEVYSMPVIEVIAGDSTRLIPAPDTIFLKQVVTEMPDSVAVEALPLKENTDYMTVPFAVNYPYIIIGLIILALITGAVIIFFGKSIVAAWKIYWIRRRHKKFMELFEQQTAGLSGDLKVRAERIIVTWKQYLQRLESFPYTSLTTRDLMEVHPDKTLGKALHDIDAAMYDPKSETLDASAFSALREYAEVRFQHKIETLKAHG